jgi:radical SAM superfamily enzyme YgiQ (UPF0313 family)
MEEVFQETVSNKSYAILPLFYSEMKLVKKIVFIQLPLLNHSYDYLLGNIEYASASIAGYIKGHVTDDIEIYGLPSIVAQFCSDALIVKYILAIKPNIVAFTSYLWNIERNLHIARMIKQHAGNAQIIFGGSEIHSGSISLTEHRDYVDYFVTGEGEWFFDLLLSGKDLKRYTALINGNHVVTQPDYELIPSEKIFEPFTGKRLNPMPDGSMFFELTRGCPYKCSYCFYSKNAPAIREMPFDMLLNVLTNEGLTRNLRELYVLSPALNITNNFREKLHQLSAIHKGIRLHSEMRAEGIDEETARLIYQAGFRSMEVGLQTLSINSLHMIGRKSNPEKELAGMLCLQRAGIDLKIGLIPGLPGDTAESFIKTVERLISLGFRDNIELYPLMILPGTSIRDTALRDNINYLRKPPYYYNYGWGISFDEMRYITRYVENATGSSHIVKKLPDFACHEQGLYCRGIYFNGDELTKWNIDLYRNNIETNVFSFYIAVDSIQSIYQGLPELVKSLPEHELFNIVFYSNDPLDENRVLDILNKIDGDNFFRRLHIFHEWMYGCKIRIYQVMDEYQEYKKALTSYAIITPIFRIHTENYHTLTRINDYEDNILISKGAYAGIKKNMAKFADSIESVAFEDPGEQEEFYKTIGCEYTQLPFEFKVMKR